MSPLRAALGALAVALLTGLLTAPPLVAVPPAPTAPGPAPARAQPLVHTVQLADPTVVEDAGGRYVMMGTGAVMPRVESRGSRGPWRPLEPAMTVFPSWVAPGDMWAPDLHQVGEGAWVLYYSAPAVGLTPGARCIGAAVSTTATGPFTAVSDVPLVCASRLGLPPAEDQIRGGRGGLPDSGAIDASVYRERDGRLFLLYKTQGQPSSIRMVPLTPDGQHVQPGKISRPLLRSTGIVENPVLVRRDDRYVLFTSEGYFGDCDYRTTYRQSRSRLRGWHTSSTNLLGPTLTGLCGPGGADVVRPAKGGKERLFFHGWLCNETTQPCPRDFRVARDQSLIPRRGVYGAVLDWTEDDVPVIDSYLKPRG